MLVSKIHRVRKRFCEKLTGGLEDWNAIFGILVEDFTSPCLFLTNVLGTLQEMGLTVLPDA
jgi:hypothetical protein